MYVLLGTSFCTSIGLFCISSYTAVLGRIVRSDPNEGQLNVDKNAV